MGAAVKPLADFVCNAKACRSETGDAPMYELPVDATRCPYGHKSIRRLYNSVAVIGTRNVQPDIDPRLTSSSPMVRVNTLMQPDMDRAYENKSSRASDMPSYSLGQFQRSNVDEPLKQSVTQAIMTAKADGEKGRPMSEMEIARARRTDPGHLATHLHKLKGGGLTSIPTEVVGR